MSEPAEAQWLPLAVAGAEPHVLVDAGALPSTALALSHWPGSPTPPRWRRDTSTGCVLAFLAESPRGGRWWDAGLPRVVATDHLDQDGLAAAALLLHPEEGARRGATYEALAAAGDFAVVGPDRDAVRASFALATLADPERSPLAAARKPVGPARDGELGAELLERLGSLVGEPGSWRELWADEEAALVASLDAIASRSVVLREVPEVDLVVVTVTGRPPLGSGTGGAEGVVTRFLARVSAPVHPAAIHAHSTASRVLLVAGQHLSFSYRYESWVRLVSGQPPARVDLERLAAELTAAEPGGARWAFDGVAALVPRLGPVGEGGSDLAPGVVEAALVRALREGPAAWGPEGPLSVDLAWGPEGPRPVTPTGELEGPPPAAAAPGRRVPVPGAGGSRLLGRWHREAGRARRRRSTGEQR